MVDISTIFFESIFSNYAARLTRNGSMFLIVMTQDGWWRSTTGYKQHFEFARFRAAEQGRTLIQASVDGISGLISSQGVIVDQTAIRSRASRIYQVPIMTHKTFYARFGDFWNWLILGIWFSIIVFQVVRIKTVGPAELV